MSHLYAEVRSNDVGEESHLQALKVVAWCCRELQCGAGIESLRWFVAEELSNGKRSEAWDRCEHVSEFTSENRIDGQCSSGDEIWVRAGLGETGTREVIMHEMCHLKIKRTVISGGDGEEGIVEDYTASMMRAFNQEQAEADFVQWLVDPSRWETHARGGLKNAKPRPDADQILARVRGSRADAQPKKDPAKAASTLRVEHKGTVPRREVLASIKARAKTPRHPHGGR